jgi:hypothetical protein
MPIATPEHHSVDENTVGADRRSHAVRERATSQISQTMRSERFQDHDNCTAHPAASRTSPSGGRSPCLERRRIKVPTVIQGCESKPQPRASITNGDVWRKRRRKSYARAFKARVIR